MSSEQSPLRVLRARTRLWYYIQTLFHSWKVNAVGAAISTLFTPVAYYSVGAWMAGLYVLATVAMAILSHKEYHKPIEVQLDKDLPRPTIRDVSFSDAFTSPLRYAGWSLPLLVLAAASHYGPVPLPVFLVFLFATFFVYVFYPEKMGLNA